MLYKGLLMIAVGIALGIISWQIPGDQTWITFIAGLLIGTGMSTILCTVAKI